MKVKVLKNCKIVTTKAILEGEILIEDGKISKIRKSLSSFNADETIDVKGNIVLPGPIDAHAHLYDPAYLYREDFQTGTISAAFGGITTVVEMVLQTPVDSPGLIKEKIEIGEKNSLIDFSLHAGMMNEKNLENMDDISRLGVRSFKTFMCKPYYVTDETLFKLLLKASNINALINVHAEDESTVESNTLRILEEGRKDPLAHNESRPNKAEEIAIQRAIGLARKAQARLHISHMSTSEGAKLVKEAKRKGIKITAETCPHYLVFTKKDVVKKGPYLKMNPPLRSNKDNEALWKGLKNGYVDIVTSEHAPGTKEEKEKGWGNIWDAWGGIPGIETMLPILMSEGVNKGRLSFFELYRVLCLNPAKIFGLYPIKGSLSEGCDADIVVIDRKLKKKIRGENLHYKVGWSPYEGMVLKGWPVVTIVRGEVLVKDNELLQKPGYGKFVLIKEFKEV
ncbi:MAG: dihydroorotase family protein [Candidatus Bathyarchaeia archaeon]